MWINPKIKNPEIGIAVLAWIQIADLTRFDKLKNVSSNAVLSFPEICYLWPSGNNNVWMPINLRDDYKVFEYDDVVAWQDLPIFEKKEIVK